MNTPVYSWEFIGELVSWSRISALIVAIAGGVIMGDTRFAMTCAAAAAIDIWLFSRIAVQGRKRLGDTGQGVNYGVIAGLVGARFAAKSVLLVLAAVLPRFVSFWGMVAGVLVVDTTLFLIGGIAATVRTFGSAHTDSSGG